MEALVRDLRYALRTLLRSPALMLVAVFSLALAIGANTTIFTVIHAIFLKPLPVTEPERVLSLFRTFQQRPDVPVDLHSTSYLNYRDLSEQASSFSELAAFGFSSFSLSPEGGEPEQVSGFFVSGNYFAALGLEPAHGRFFVPEEDAVPGSHPVVVLGSALWHRAFGGDPAVVGRTVRLNGHEFTVVGIAPASFRGTYVAFGVDLWVPLAMATTLNPVQYETAIAHRGYRYFDLFGRLAPGVTAQQATAECEAIAERLAEAFPEWNRNRGFELMTLAESTIPPAMRGLYVRSGQVLMGAVALVLLIACANVANLLLARASRRQKEIAMRVSLGATPARLVRQLLAEGLVLAFLGGGTGFILAIWFRRLLWSLRPPFLGEEAFALEAGGAVFAFSLVVSLATGLLVGLLPALQATRRDVVTALKGDGNDGEAGAPFGSRQVLVAAQVGLSLVCLVGAGLFLVSLQNAFDIDPGFDHERVASLSWSGQSYGPEDGLRFYDRVLEEVRALPGVDEAALARGQPFSFSASYRFFIPGKEDEVGPDGMYIDLNMVTPSYFETLGLDILEGRSFDSGDRRDGRPVTVINQTLAERFWGEESPIGSSVKWGGEEEPWEIVGVVADMKYSSLGEDPKPYLYRPMAQDFSESPSLLMKTNGPPSALLPLARQVVRELDAELPIVGEATMSEVLEETLWAPSMGASLLGVFGLIALVLASFGIYGVLAQVVQARRREMGIRVALGARPVEILGLAVRQGMLPVWIGVAVGTAGALGVARLLENLLYGVSGADPRVLVTAAGMLVAVAFLACWLPAQTATRVDPQSVLRSE